MTDNEGGAERRKAHQLPPCERRIPCDRDARLSALHCGVLISASGRAFAGYTGRQPAPGRRLVVARRAEFPTPPECEVTSPARRRRIHSASGLSPETPLGEWNDVTIVLPAASVKDKIHKKKAKVDGPQDLTAYSPDPPIPALLVLMAKPQLYRLARYVACNTVHWNRSDALNLMASTVAGPFKPSTINAWSMPRSLRASCSQIVSLSGLASLHAASPAPPFAMGQILSNRAWRDAAASAL